MFNGRIDGIVSEKLAHRKRGKSVQTHSIASEETNSKLEKWFIFY